VRVEFKQAARDDVTAQFRYYLEQASPQVALRFRERVKSTVSALGQNPCIAPIFPAGDPDLVEVRSWPVAGFDVIRLYFMLTSEAMVIIRVLHGKRNVRTILRREVR